MEVEKYDTPTASAIQVHTHQAPAGTAPHQHRAPRRLAGIAYRAATRTENCPLKRKWRKCAREHLSSTVAGLPGSPGQPG